MGNLRPKPTRDRWPRYRVVTLLSKLRAGAIAKGEHPSAVLMAERLQSHLLKRYLRGDDRAAVCVAELVRIALVQCAGSLNKSSVKASAVKDGQRVLLSTPAVDRRGDRGEPIGIRETPPLEAFRLEQLTEVRDRLRRQVIGTNVHLAQIDFLIDLFDKHNGETVGDVCLAAGIDPRSLDLDDLLGAI